MKTIPADLLNCGTLVFAVRVVRSDNLIVSWTQHDRDQTVLIDGFETPLVSNTGFNIESLVSTAGLGVDNTNIYVVSADDELNRADILAKKWDGAQVYFFRYNWKLPLAGIIPVKRGSFGNFTPLLGKFKVEFRDIRQAMQQNTTWVFQESCRWRLGDARCRKDLGPLTFGGTVTAVGETPPVEPPTTGTLTSVLDEGEFTDSALAEATDHFKNGLFVFTSGINAGRGRVVLTDSLGEFTMISAFPDLPEVGDAYSVSVEEFGAVSPTATFTSATLGQANDFFGEGSVTWLSGLNAGTQNKVKAFSSHVVTLSESTIRPVHIGDSFLIVAGCRHRWEEDCKGKFNNLLNFGGEKDKPTRDALIAPPVEPEE